MRIIYVDDEKYALELVSCQLKEIERVTAVETFLSSEEALTYLGRAPVDVALLDIAMREMDGLSLAKRIREISPRTRILFLTGYSQYALEAFRLHVSGYLLKPLTREAFEAELDYMEELKPLIQKQRIKVQCFGNFEVFAGNVPLVYKYSKTKELLAYLVDRKGAVVNTSQLCSVLWEDKPDTSSLRSQLRNLLSDLSQSLEKADAKEMLIKKRNSFAVAVDSFDCDYYRFLRQEVSAVNTYSGEYMAQYSWAEMTLAFLEYQKHPIHARD